MINESLFKEINDDVHNSVIEMLDGIKNNISNYVFLLANGEYLDQYSDGSQGISPYSIDNRVDGYQDYSRLEFIVEFLKKYYSFSSEDFVSDSMYRINIELMIYTHVWESKPLLKKLYRIAHMLDGKEYEWTVCVPDMSKHEFIRNDIREVLIKNGFSLGEVIRKGFHTSIRNAFAHSEYSFDTLNNSNRINFYNYNGKSWELKNVSFDEWSSRFVYSVLLSYHLERELQNKRSNISRDLGADTFDVSIPGMEETAKIKYNEPVSGFSFIK